MPIKTVKSTIDIEIQNENLDFFYLRNIEINDSSMSVFRLILLLEQAEFEESATLPLPIEWYQHMPWCTGCFIRRNVFGHIFFVIKNKQGSVEFETSSDEIKSFYHTDEFTNEGPLAEGVVSGSFIKDINIAGTVLVTDRKEYIILVGDNGIESVFVNKEPFTITDAVTSTEENWRKVISNLPLMIRGVYEEEEE